MSACVELRHQRLRPGAETYRAPAMRLSFSRRVTPDSKRPGAVQVTKVLSLGPRFLLHFQLRSRELRDV